MPVDLTKQPFDIFFDVQLGGLNKIYENPEIPIDFTFIHEATGPMNKVMINLFDLTGFRVEPNIWKAQNPLGLLTGAFEFGYQNGGPKSPQWDFQFDEYDPVFNGNSFIVSLTATTNMEAAISNNKITGTLNEIINKFADIYGYQVDIEQPFGTKYMLSTGYLDSETTELRELQHTKHADESDWNYIRRICTFARDGQGIGGYVPHEVMRNGQKFLVISHPLDPNTIDFTFDVQAPETTVVNWQPNIKFGSNVVAGANDTHVNSIEKITGNTIKFPLHQAVTKKYQAMSQGQQSSLKPVQSTPLQDPPTEEHYVCSETMPNNLTKNSSRTRAVGMPTAYAEYNNPLTSHLLAWMGCSGGRLVVLGDPQLYPGRNCDIICHYPPGHEPDNDPTALHYSSGAYRIARVTHNISDGMYLSILDLERSALIGQGTTPGG